jgi:hypothetical protein
MPAPVGFCYLKDQRPISQEAYRHACRLREQVRALIAGRADFLKRTRRSPAVHLPHGNWELGHGLYAGHAALLDGDYSVVNNLRLFSQVFTGFQLLSFSRDRTVPFPRAVPPDLDERLKEIAAEPGWDVEAYRQTTAHLPEALHITPPNVFGEVGWVVDGKIVNHDTNVYLERLVLLAECGKLWELRGRSPHKQGWSRPRILEIGPGYGGLAHHLMGLVPESRYFLVDVPESLLFSSIYLSTLWPEHDNVLITPDNLADLGKDAAGFTFVPNFLFDDCCAAGLELDLVINTLSMSEMTEKQVRYYCKGISRLIGRRGVFFEQNQDNSVLGAKTAPVGFLRERLPRRFGSACDAVRRLLYRRGLPRPAAEPGALSGMIDAKSVLAKFFRLCLPLRTPVLTITQGAPHLWADTPLPPYPWRPAHAALRPGPFGVAPAPTKRTGTS